MISCDYIQKPKFGPLKGISCWPKCFDPLPTDLLLPIYTIKPHLYCILIAGENPHQFMLQNIDNVKDFYQIKISRFSADA